MTEPTTFFDYALGVVLRNEGGLVETAAASALGDPGGETYKGITAKTLQGLGIEKAPSLLTDEEIRTIYFDHYWAIAGGPRVLMPDGPGLALAVFDAGVQSGVRTAIRWLQEAIGAKVDGVVGPRTCEAVRRAGELTAIIRFHELRRLSLCRFVQLNAARLPMLPGLIGRVDLVERTALYVLLDEHEATELRDVASSEALVRAI